MEDAVWRAAIHQSLPLGNVVHVVEDEAVGGEGEDVLGGQEAGISASKSCIRIASEGS